MCSCVVVVLVAGNDFAQSSFDGVQRMNLEGECSNWFALELNDVY
jgi:hypothetical protein